MSDQNIRRSYIIFYKGRHIKTFHIHNIISRFQLIKGKEVFYQSIHLRRLVHNHIAVKVPALLIVIDSLFQPFRIALYQCNRCLKFMRNIGEELPASLVHLVLSLNILQKLVVGRTQFGDRLFQYLRHFINVIAEYGNFRLVISLIFGLEIQMLHPLRNIGQLENRFRNPV